MPDIADRAFPEGELSVLLKSGGMPYYGLPSPTESERISLKQHGYLPARSKAMDFPEPTQWNGADLRNWPSSSGAPVPYVCLDCDWRRRGIVERVKHWRAYHHRIVWGGDPRALAKKVTE